MALELIGGAVLGAVFGEFLSAVTKAKQNVGMFNFELEELEATLEELYPLMQERNERNKRLNRTSGYEKETEIIKGLMEGKKLVCKCFKVGRWSLYKKLCYRSKLVKLNNKLSHHRQSLILLSVNDIVMSLNLSPNHRGFSNLTVGVTGSSPGPSNQITFLEVIIQVGVRCDKCRIKALKIVACTRGVATVSFMDKTVISFAGGDIDVVCLARKLRRFCGFATIMQVIERSKMDRLFNSSTIIRGSNMNENDNDDVRNHRNPNTLSHSGSIISPALRISEYEDDEMNDNGLSEVLALPPPHSDVADGTTTGGLENEVENMTTKCDDEPLLMQRVYALEATARKLEFFTPAIMLLSCFNLVTSFLILYLYKESREWNK